MAGAARPRLVLGRFGRCLRADVPFSAADAQRFARSDRLAHLWLVPNAPHHPQGDFGIDAASGLATPAPPRFTWASVGLFRASMFDGVAPDQPLKLRPLLDSAIAGQRLSAQRWSGGWIDVGTALRLREADAAAAA